jgi:hypothetical protein
VLKKNIQHIEIPGFRHDDDLLVEANERLSSFRKVGVPVISQVVPEIRTGCQGRDRPHDAGRRRML